MTVGCSELFVTNVCLYKVWLRFIFYMSGVWKMSKMVYADGWNRSFTYTLLLDEILLWFLPSVSIVSKILEKHRYFWSHKTTSAVFVFQIKTSSANQDCLTAYAIHYYAYSLKNIVEAYFLRLTYQHMGLRSLHSDSYLWLAKLLTGRLD